MDFDGEKDEAREVDQEPSAEGDQRPLLSRLASPRTAVTVGLALFSIAFLGALGYWILLPTRERGPDAPTGQNVLSALSAKREDTQRQIVKQDLSPFYIPLSRDGNGQMARVSFAVTWDRSSSDRFEDQKTRVRDQLYGRLKELAGEGENVRGISLTIRAEAQRILEEHLHPSELHVVVTGLFIV